MTALLVLIRDLLHAVRCTRANTAAWPADLLALRREATRS